MDIPIHAHVVCTDGFVGKSSHIVVDLITERVTHFVIKTVIPKNVALKDASFNKQDIFSHKPTSKGALAYKKLIQELFI